MFSDMRLRIFGMLIFLLSAFAVSSQSVYKLDLRTEAAILGSSMAFGVTNLAIRTSLEPLSLDEISALDHLEINRLDRSAVEYYSLSAATRSHVGMISSFGLAGLSILGHTKNTEKDHQLDEFLTLAIILAEVNLLTLSAKNLSKDLTLRPRPFVYNVNAALDKKLEKDARRSFFSGHTSMSAANTFFVAKVFSDYYPNSNLRPFVWTVAAIIPAWTATERFLAGKHFPTDLLAGYAFGAMCGYLIPHFHKAGQDNAISISPFSTGEFQGLSVTAKF